MKFQRNYKLIYTIPIVNEDGTIDKKNAEQITITYPLKCEFSIERTTFAQSNKATFNIYNLKLSTRNKVYQDMYNINRWCFVDFYAGYGDNMPLIFTGKVITAMPERQGTDIITTIQAMDNDIIQSYSNHTFEAGTSKKEALNTLVSDFTNVKLGSVGNMEGTLENRYVVSDKTFVAIDKLTGGHAFIDNDKLHVLNNNEVLGDVGIYKITSETGLLGTPRRQDAQLEIDCIFAPEVTVGQMIEIESTTAPAQYNGQYKAIGLTHRGNISGADCGTVTTTLNLFVGVLLPNSNFIWSGVMNEPVSEVKGNKVQELTQKDMATIREVYNYLLKNRKPPHQKITSNIWWDEVLMNYSLQGSTPSIDVLSNLYATATNLQTFVDKFYPNNKIKITSGWRSASYNPKIGGAPNSQHIQGRAIDFILPGQTLYYVYNYFSKYWSYGFKQLGSGYIHCDTRSTIVKGVANDR